MPPGTAHVRADGCDERRGEVELEPRDRERDPEAEERELEEGGGARPGVEEDARPRELDREKADAARDGDDACGVSTERKSKRRETQQGQAGSRGTAIRVKRPSQTSP